MPEQNAGEGGAGTVSIIRLPVFDDRRRLWGYALHCVGETTQPPEEASRQASAAITVATSAYIGIQKIIGRDKKVLVDVTQKNLLDHLPYALPPDRTAIQINETIYHHPSVPTVLEKLKSDGYLLAVTAFTGRPDNDPLYASADIICVDTNGKSRDELIAIRDAARHYGAILMACEVDDPDQFRRLKTMEFDLFRGAFYKSPETISVRTLSSNEMSRFNLMRAIQQEEVDIDRLAETIQSDASLSFRLLAYLNSAAFGFRQKIKSIHQAIKLLGWRKMRIWLRVVLLNDVNQSQDAAELMLLAARRGRFLESICQTYGYWGFDPESLHLLGIFSLLDAMLGMPMPEITTYLPIDEKLKSALCADPDSEYLPLLLLAKKLEEHRWHDAQQTMQELNLDENVVRHAYREAVEWADELDNMQNGIEQHRK